MSRSRELLPDELSLVNGGSQRLFSSVTLGSTPSHVYGLISAPFGAGNENKGIAPMQAVDANTLVQKFNAPTYEGLYGAGNDPNATAGTISRPGAQELHGQELPTWIPGVPPGVPADSGGNVTLEHGNGWAVNTTIPNEHPLEGTISRNLVTDFHDNSGYQFMTLGQGVAGSPLSTSIGQSIGSTVGDFIAGKFGADLGGAAGATFGQNASHFLNPGAGETVFSQLDANGVAHGNGLPNPNLNLPHGAGTEVWDMGGAALVGLGSLVGLGPQVHGNAQLETLGELGHELVSQGPVRSSFGLSSNGVGVYQFTDGQSPKYFEMDSSGHLVQKEADPASGVDAAIAHQAELNASLPQPHLDGNVVIPLPDPPPLVGLSPELTPHTDNGQSGSAATTQHADGSLDAHPIDAGTVTASADVGAHVDTGGSQLVDNSVHINDSAPVITASATVDASPVITASAGIDASAAIGPMVNLPPPPPPIIDIPAPPPIAVVSTDPVGAAPIAPIVIPVAPPVNPVVDTGVTGDPGGGTQVADMGEVGDFGDFGDA